MSRVRALARHRNPMARKPPILSTNRDKLSKENRATIAENGLDDELLIEVTADLDANGRYTRRFLVATANRVQIYTEGQARPDHDFAISELTAIKSHSLAGASTLEARVPAGQETRQLELLRGTGSKSRMSTPSETKGCSLKIELCDK